MAPPQKPETFMLSNEAQQSLPHDAQVALQQVDNLKYFLISAPVDWSPDQYLRRFLLPTGEYVSCVLWNNLFHISGTDIVRCLSFRFQAFGRPVRNAKKFEEGIFSDLRNLKAGTDASLEDPKSPFLDFLYKNNCIRTQKKQKVFYWYSVPHDRLFLDALERDLKREKMGQEATTVAVAEPALSFEFDSSQSLFEQLTKAQQANTSSFSAHAGTPFSQSTSPVIRAVDSMPPPQMLPPRPPIQQQQQHHHHHQHHQQAQQQQQQQQQQHHHQQQHHPHHPHHQHHSSLPTVAEEPLTTSAVYHQHHQAQSSSLPPSLPAPSHPHTTSAGYVKAGGEADYGHLYDRHGTPVSGVIPGGRPQVRHASMPAYLEYSPAPSFVSSGYDDYGARAISYEPLTPPQPALSLSAEPAYIANEDTGLYTALPDVTSMQSMNALSQLPPPSFGGSMYPSAAAAGPVLSRSFGPGPVYHVIEGSPTYKQRRRRSSISSGVASATAAAAAGANANANAHAHAHAHAHAAHRPSDLRRSVSGSVPPVPEGDESAIHDSPPPQPVAVPTAGHMATGHGAYGQALHGASQSDLLDLSRHGTPLPTLEGSPALGAVSAAALMPPPDDFGVLAAGIDRSHDSATPGSVGGGGGGGAGRGPSGPVRRPRSSTLDLGPYPQKSHSCPIPTCGRLFKRLEHLKRHVRTHTQERPYRCPFCNKAFSRSDNLAQHRKTHEREDGGSDAPGLYNSEEDLEGDEPLGHLDDGSPDPDTRDLHGSMVHLTSMSSMTMNGLGIPSATLAAPSQLVNPHSHAALLQQTI